MGDFQKRQRTAVFGALFGDAGNGLVFLLKFQDRLEFADHHGAKIQDLI